MKGTFYFLVKPKAKRYNNTVKIKDKELILNSEIFSHEYISREAVVVGLPSNFKTKIKVGDTLIIHHNVFRRWHDARGKERNSTNWIDDDLYKVNVDQIYAYKRDKEWKAIDGYCFVKPIDKELMGVVKYGKHQGKLVGFRPSSEYEFTIDNEKLYRVLEHFITIEYGSEEEKSKHNRSWLQSC